MTTTRSSRQVIVAPEPAAAEPDKEVKKQRRWAIAVLVIIVGAGVVTAVAKGRYR